MNATRAREIDPSLRIGAVHLGVADVSRSIDFYAGVLGLALIGRDEHHATLAADGEHGSLLLHGIENPTSPTPHSTGLFHVAWLHPSRSALAATIERVIGAHWPIHGASDHGVSEALYLSDPDGLGVEVYADRPREQWPRTGDGEGVDMFTRPLDLDSLLAQAPLAPTPAIDPATVVGHVHLKVSDVARAVAFYRDVLGFAEQAHLPSAAFLSAGGYHHHVGLNSWQSRGARADSADAPGLREATFQLGSAVALGALESRLADAGEEHVVVARDPARVRARDPDGNRLTFVAPRPG